MSKDEEQELSSEQALERAKEAAETGILAQMGITIQTPDELSLKLATQLLEATTIEDLLDDASTTSWGEHEGRSVLIKSVSYAPSTKRGGLGFYAVVEAVDVDNNKPLLLISGGQNVVIQLAKMVQMKALDVPVKLISNLTGEGNTVHRLVKGTPGENPPF